MRPLLLHVILVLLFSNALYAADNACQMDLYFANGMMGSSQYSEERTWKKYVQELKKTNPILNTRTLNARVAYNASELGGLGDVYEVLFQRIVGNTISWLKLQDMFIKYVDDNDLIETYNRLSQVFNYEDLATQIQSYRQSIYNGHGVIVVAHSQGNFFTNKSFEYLDDWMTSHFYMIGVASPSTVVVNGGPRISFDNDPVPIISLAPWTIRNENRSRVESMSLDLPSFKFHGFNYYMGESVTVSDLGKTKRVSTFVAKEAIGYGILGAIENYAQCFCPEKDSEDLVAKRGVVEVGLSWLYPQVNMDLTFSLGTKDISDVKGWTYEHYYVDEESIEPGVYPVSISGSYGLPTECTQDFEIDEQAPEIIGISIATPGDSAFFMLEARSPEEFNIGNVADVFICKKGSEDCPEDGIEIIPKQEKGEAKITTVCHGDCEQIFIEGNSTTLDYFLFKVIPKLSQGLLGPLGGANINVFKAKEYSNAIEALFTGATTSGSSIYTTGLINIPNVFVEQLEDEVYYVVEIEGGSDIDANDDMKVDEVATTNNGTLHALLTGKEIKAKGFKVNILTEAAYQVSKHLLDTNNTTSLSAHLDDIALRLIKKDVSGDNVVDKADLYKWLPSSHKKRLYADYNSRIDPIVQKIYANEEIYDDAFILIYKPYFTVPLLFVDENSSLNTVIDTINMGAYSNNVSVTLTGEDAEYFAIDNNGTITFASESIVNYETKSSYSISIMVENNYGSYSEDVTVFVKNTPSGTAPVLKDINVTINKDTSINTVIGNIFENTANIGHIVKVTLLPKSPFEISLNGDIKLTTSLLEHNASRFELLAQAENSYGKSDVVDVNITIFKVLVIEDFTVSLLDGSTSNTTVGSINIIKNGTPITSVALQGEGNEDFTVDINGTLHVAVGVTLDYNTRSDYNLTVVINDTYDANVSIYVLNQIIASVDTPDHAQGVVFSSDGSKAYVADWFSGLQIIDISDPTAPFIIGFVDIPGSAHGVTLSLDGSKAYVAGGGSGLQIIDISNPKAPFIIASINTPNSAQAVTLSSDGTKAYVADWFSGLQIIDISNLKALFIIASVDTPDYARAVTLSSDGTKAYVADSVSGLQIIDISDPTAPSIIASVDISGSAYGVILSLDGSKAYVADAWSGLQIIDISDPTAPSIIGFVDTPGSAYGVTLSLDGSKAYVADGSSGLQIIDISDPTASSIIAFVDTPDDARGVTLSFDGSKAYVADGNSGLQIIDISNPTIPIPSVDTPGDARGVTLSGDGSTVYVAGSGSGLQIIDVSDPTDSSIIASVDTPFIALGVTLSLDGSKAYVADSDSGLQIIDVSDLTAPSIIAFVDTPDDARGVTLSLDGSKAYIADYGSGLQIIDISDPTTPSIIASVDTPYAALAVSLSSDGSKAYVADGSSGLQIIDISDSTAPSIIGFVDIPSFALAVTLSSDGSKAYIAGGGSGLQIIDISNPKAPFIIASINTPNSAQAVTLSSDGTKAYVADSDSGLQIIDISNPIAPFIIASVDTPGSALDVTLSLDGSKAYVADDSSGLVIIDISGF